MDTIAAYVGDRIRFFRKLNSLSINELADRVHKSKSTLSKYENGIITIDIQSLDDIAKALNVSISQFLDYDNNASERVSAIKLHPFFDKDHLYYYWYDGRYKRVISNYIKIIRNGSDSIATCHVYMDIPDSVNYEKCKFFYSGTIESYDLFTFMSLINQTNTIDRLEMFVQNPFNSHTTKCWGLKLGVSTNPFGPLAFKTLISDRPLKREDISQEALSFSSADIKMIRNNNMILL